MENKPKLSHEIIAASSGALITSLFVTPLDVVKTRLQVQQKNLLSKRCFLYHNGLMDHLFYCLNGNGNGNGNGNNSGAAKGFQRPPSHWIYRPNHFDGTRDAFVKIVRNEGLTSLWSGLSPTLVLAIPTTVLYFLSYEKLKNELYKINQNSSTTTNTDQKSHSFWIPVVAGSSARFIAATLVSPLELIRTKMLSTKLSYFQIGQALKSLIKSNGLSGLWKGLTPTLLRDVPFSAMYWSSFEYLKSFNKSTNLTSTESFAQNFFAGAVSGFIAATVTLPFDVVKTHQQIELGENVYKLASVNNAIEKPANTMTIIGKIYRQNGAKGLFAGYVPRVTKVAPACAIMISVFEYGKHMLNSKMMVEETSEGGAGNGTGVHHQQQQQQKPSQPHHPSSRSPSSMPKKSVVILDTL